MTLRAAPTTAMAWSSGSKATIRPPARFPSRAISSTATAGAESGIPEAAPPGTLQQSGHGQGAILTFAPADNSKPLTVTEGASVRDSTAQFWYARRRTDG